MTRIYSIVLCALMALVANAHTIDLSGKWKAAFPSGETSQVSIPGTLDMAGVGEPNRLVPVMEKPQLLRLTRKVSYIGPCTYSRQIEIPASMAGKSLRLKMERVLWKSSLKIDGMSIHGENKSLTTPHYFEIPPLKAGNHTMEITIDNSQQYDISTQNLCHSYTNDTQTMWNGVLGEFTLTDIPAVELEMVKVYPDHSRGGVEVEITVNNHNKDNKKCGFTFDVSEKASAKAPIRNKVSYKAPTGRTVFKHFVAIDGAKSWSDLNPDLYVMNVSDGKSSKAITFGMREVSTNGKSLLVNGRKIFLRGTLDCCIFPLTGVPPTDKEGWKKEMEILQAWGFNHIRFHSWCPPEAAFEVADSMGFYLQTELPVWSLKIGDDPQVTEFLSEEFHKMSDAYGNHPSWIMTTCGNELQHDFNVLNDMVKEMRDYDSRHLYAATSFTFEKGHGGHAEPYDQFLITQWSDDGWVRGQGVFDKVSPSFDKNYASAMGCVKVPLVSHEIGQYAVYPDLSEIEKYTGVLDPLNFKAVKADLEKKGLIGKAADYLKATGSFAKILYKEEIERALKTPGFSGVQLLGIQDFPGQGTALVGLINSFWESKGVTDASDFRHFNSPVVPLANFPKAVYTSEETFQAVVDIANYGQTNLNPDNIVWELSDASGNRKSGTLASATLPQGEVMKVGSVQVALNDFSIPSKLTFKVAIPNTEYENSWNIWVYPVIEKVNTRSVVVTSSLDTAKKELAKGGKVLFMPETDKVNGIESKFLPVFWSPVHFPKQAGGMGVITQSAHPALKGFPNDGHSDWQWWKPVKNASVMHMDAITDIKTGQHIEPIIGVIDNFLHNRRLGYMFETKCGKGTLVVSSINLSADSPEIKSLYKGVLEYMNSSAFKPANEINSKSLENIVSGTEIKTTKSTSIYE